MWEWGLPFNLQCVHTWNNLLCSDFLLNLKENMFFVGRKSGFWITAVKN